LDALCLLEAAISFFSLGFFRLLHRQLHDQFSGMTVAAFGP